MVFYRAAIGGGGGGTISCGTSVLKTVRWDTALGSFTTSQEAIGFTLSTIQGGLGRSYTVTCFGSSAHLAYDTNGTINNSDLTLSVTYSNNAITINNVAGDIHSTLNAAGANWKWSLTPIYEN